MEVQKLSNLKQLTADWEKDRAAWLKSEVPRMLTVCLLTCSLLYGFSFFVPDNSYLLGGIILSLLLLLPLLYTSYPKKPSQADVDANVSLRRAFDMDATVSDEK
ncbi:MAG: hypothetical protein HRT95_05670 [Moritella sp.]|uniref:hypothetical protein n=1 Tax=Moritella sp. TaxID=78556 RepID=UPI001D646388|nr:hypothetical protein [Moritella sp.]NQZ49679.1 hypothetical protein [Moritella sp.]